MTRSDVPGMSIHLQEVTQTLLRQLAAQHQRTIGIVAELDDEAMHRVVLPSGWTCAGMIQHLTCTTRFWCEEVMAGRPDDQHPEDEFVVPAGQSREELISAYAEAARHGPDLVRDLPLDTPPAWWPEGRWGPWRLTSLHEVLLHLLVEISTHAGHLDVVRELIDGRTWDYPSGRLTDRLG